MVGDLQGAMKALVSENKVESNKDNPRQLWPPQAHTHYHKHCHTHTLYTSAKDRSMKNSGFALTVFEEIQ